MSISDDMGIPSVGGERPQIEHKENQSIQPLSKGRVAELRKHFEPGQSTSSPSATASTSAPLSARSVKPRGKGKGKKARKGQVSQKSLLTTAVSTIREGSHAQIKTSTTISHTQHQRPLRPQVLSTGVHSSSSSAPSSSTQAADRVRYEQPQDEIYDTLSEYYKTKDPILYLVVENGITSVRCTNIVDLEKPEMADEKIIQGQPSKSGEVSHTHVVRKKSLFRNEVTATTTRRYDFDPMRVGTHLLQARNGYFSYTEKLSLQPLAREIMESTPDSDEKTRLLNAISIPSDQSEIYTNPLMNTAVEEIERTIPQIGGATETLTLQRFVSEKPAPEVKHDIPLRTPGTPDSLHNTLKHYYTLKQRGRKPVMFLLQKKDKPPELTVQLQEQISRSKDLAQIQRDTVGSLESEKGKTIAYNFHPFDVATFIIQSRSGNLSLTERVMLKDLVKEIITDPKITQESKHSIYSQMEIPDASDVMAVIDATYGGAVPGVRNCDLALVDPQTKAMLVVDGVGHNDPTVVEFDHPFFKEMNDAMNEYIRGYDFTHLTDPEQFGRDFEKEFLRYWDTQYREGPIPGRFAQYQQKIDRERPIIAKLTNGDELSPEEMSTYLASIDTEKCQISLERETKDYEDKKQIREDFTAAKTRLQQTDPSNAEEMEHAEGEVKRIGLQLLNLYGLDQTEAARLVEKGASIVGMADDFDNAHLALIGSIRALGARNEADFRANDATLLQLSRKYQGFGIPVILHNRTILGTRYSNVQGLAGRSRASGGGAALGLAIPFRTADGRQHVYTHNYSDVSALIITPKEGEVIVDPNNVDTKQQVKIIQQDNQQTTIDFTSNGFGGSRDKGSIGQGITTSFPPGSALFLITDGAGEFTTGEELSQAVLRNLYGTPEEISDGIIEEVTRPEHQKKDFDDKIDESRMRAAWNKQPVKKFDPTGKDSGGLDDLAFAGFRTINLSHFSSQIEEMPPPASSTSFLATQPVAFPIPEVKATNVRITQTLTVERMRTSAELPPLSSSAPPPSSSSSQAVVPEAPPQKETDRIHRSLQEYYYLTLDDQHPIIFLKQRGDGAKELKIIREGWLEGVGFEEERRIYQDPSKAGAATRGDQVESYDFNPQSVANWILAQRQGELSHSERIFLRSLAKEIEAVGGNEELLSHLALSENPPPDTYLSGPGMTTRFEAIERRIPTRDGAPITHSITRLITENSSLPPVDMALTPTSPSARRGGLYGTLQVHDNLFRNGQHPVLFVKQKAGEAPQLEVSSRTELEQKDNINGVYQSKNKKGAVKVEGRQVEYNFNPIDIAKFIIRERAPLSYSERVFLKKLAKEIEKLPSSSAEKRKILDELALPETDEVMAVVDATYSGAEVGRGNCDVAFASAETGALLVVDGVGHNNPRLPVHDHPFFQEMFVAMNDYIEKFRFSRLTTPEEFGRTFEQEFLKEWDLRYAAGPLAERAASHVNISMGDTGSGGPALGLAIPFELPDGSRHLYVHNYADVAGVIISPKPGEVLIDRDHFDIQSQSKIIQENNDRKTPGITANGFGYRPNRLEMASGTTHPFPIGSALLLVSDGAGEFISPEEATRTLLNTLNDTPQEISDALIDEVSRPDHQKVDDGDRKDTSRQTLANTRNNAKKTDPTGKDGGGLDDTSFACLRTVNPRRFRQ